MKQAKPPKLKVCGVRLPENLASTIRDIARRDRKYVSVVWEEAIRQYVEGWEKRQGAAQ